MRNLVVRALPTNARGEGAVVEECLALMRREYSGRSTLKTRPYPGIHELLYHLAGRGMPRAVLSNKPHELAVALLAHYFGPHAFDLAFGQRPGVPLKPDPAAALEICRLSGVPARAFLYLGDSGTDMRTARAAGMHPIGVLWGFRGAGELLEGGAENLLSRPMDLVSLL
jgi:phosphoglycolate phosphatase